MTYEKKNGCINSTEEKINVPLTCDYRITFCIYPKTVQPVWLTRESELMKIQELRQVKTGLFDSTIHVNTKQLVIEIT